MTSFNITKKHGLNPRNFLLGQNGTIGIYPKAWNLVVFPLPAAEVSTV